MVIFALVVGILYFRINERELNPFNALNDKYVWLITSRYSYRISGAYEPLRGAHKLLRILTWGETMMGSGCMHPR